MKQLFFLPFFLVTLLFTAQSCNKSKKDCPHCNIEDTPVDVTVTVHDTVIIDNTNNNNNNNGGNNGTPRPDQNNNGNNNNNGGTPPPPVVDNNYYVSGITVPNTFTGSHIVGRTYWGLTSKPDGCKYSTQPEAFNPVAITITGTNTGSDGSVVYTFQVDPSVTYFGQNGKYMYFRADYANGGSGSDSKNAISSAFNLQNYPFVTVY
jgi:hypothetical protein